MVTEARDIADAREGRSAGRVDRAIGPVREEPGDASILPPDDGDIETLDTELVELSRQLLGEHRLGLGRLDVEKARAGTDPRPQRSAPIAPVRGDASRRHEAALSPVGIVLESGEHARRGPKARGRLGEAPLEVGREVQRPELQGVEAVAAHHEVSVIGRATAR